MSNTATGGLVARGYYRCQNCDAMRCWGCADERDLLCTDSFPAFRHSEVKLHGGSGQAVGARKDDKCNR
jgi:hypothetical protein